MVNDIDRQRVPANPESININEELDLSWWSNEFKVSIKQLKEAIDSVGNFPGAVKYYLMK
jgi:Protein of unknown function (DUF3606)